MYLVIIQLRVCLIYLSIYLSLSLSLYLRYISLYIYIDYTLDSWVSQNCILLFVSLTPRMFLNASTSSFRDTVAAKVAIQQIHAHTHTNNTHTFNTCHLQYYRLPACACQFEKSINSINISSRRQPKANTCLDFPGLVASEPLSSSPKPLHVGPSGPM